ncbi:hypothetical protein E2C01_024765 [Portunus trituberculatus]|uniref:Uncharacterized protein n=1 Tax=Portunus trituberculatus TaxID=210409 RepID=A0A5B7EDN7_PORTR|nr:hypothetical protein [Portunus trituberculatus]
MVAGCSGSGTGDSCRLFTCIQMTPLHCWCGSPGDECAGSALDEEVPWCDEGRRRLARRKEGKMNGDNWVK